MIVALGLTLGVGALLVLAPMMWPSTGSRKQSRSMSRFTDRLRQAGMSNVSPPAVIAIAAVLGLAVGAVVFALVPVTALAIAASVVGFALPLIAIEWRGRARRRATRVVWPDVVDHLVSAVRSGLALPDSVVTLAHTGPATTRESFAEFETEYRRTGNFAVCLDSLKDRLADPTADRILETLRMSREVGGNELTTVLRNLAAYLRQEGAVRAELEARQSWLMNAAKLGVAAPWLVLLLLASRPEASAAYNTTAGAVLIVAGLGVSVIAYQVMVAISRLPEDRRWFQ